MTSLQKSLRRTKRLGRLLQRGVDRGRVPYPEAAVDVLAALNELAVAIEKRIAEETQAGATAQ